MNAPAVFSVDSIAAELDFIFLQYFTDRVVNVVVVVNPLKGRNVNWLHFAIQV